MIDDDEERDSDVEILESGKGKGKKRVRDLSEDEEDVVPVKRVSETDYLLLVERRN